jgi:hypothetical protein
MMAIKRSFLKFDMTTSQKKATSLSPMKNRPYSYKNLFYLYYLPFGPSMQSNKLKVCFVMEGYRTYTMTRKLELILNRRS